MEFDWTPEQLAFRAEIQEFLRRELPPEFVQIARKSPGSEEMTKFSLMFCPKLAEAGLLVPHWPVEYGGRGAPPWEHFILGEAMWEIGEPRGAQYYNVNWIGPTLMKYGSEEQKKYHLARMAAGDVIWCQGFSEPSAGSDLSALRTSAEPQGDRFIVNGSKIWTSYAYHAEYCFLLARVPGGRGRGITVFLMPMSQPGVTVRPIRAVVGDGDLNEVFFDDVKVDESMVLGEIGQGWDIARYALHYERIGIPRYALAARILELTVGKMSADGIFDAPARVNAALAYANCEAARLLAYSVVDRRDRNLPPDGNTSTARMATVLAENTVGEFAQDFQPQLLAGDEMPMVETHHRRVIAAGLASGAAEIQLNLIARDVLGLETNRAP
jgi:alkylation response protein AidB-like acyl-CoA dehydrogenase